MGATFGSIHFRTTDRNRIHAALTTLASQANQRFLLGPEYNGWIAIYPQDAGQDPSVSESLARDIKLPTLHILVHDDDVFAYFYYRDGELIDEYDSFPDYFGDVDEPTRERKRGRPHLLQELLPPRKSVEDLDNILHPPGGESPVFSSESAHAFVSVLKLTNALTSYEYLTDGDRDGIKGWRKFTHVPDLASERKEKQSKAAAVRREKAAAIRREKASLQKDGRLLLELKSPPGGMFAAMPLFVSDGNGSFFLAWDRKGEGDTPVFRATSKGLEETGLGATKRVHAMACSPSGRYLALALAAADSEVQLWDMAEQRLIAEIPQERAGRLVSFSGDSGTLLSGDSDGRLSLTSTETGRETQSILTSTQANNGVIHHAGHHIVMYNAVRLSILDLASQSPRQLLVHGHHDPFLFKYRLLAEVLRAYEALATKGSKGAQQKVDELQPIRQRCLKNAEGKPAPIASESTEQIQDMAFNPEGTLLACASTGGLRVYSWDELLSATHQTPPPRFAVDAEVKPDEAGSGVPYAYSHSVCFDKHGQHVLFCGFEGKVKSLDLETGVTKVILRPPQLGPLSRIALSSDDSLLALAYQPDFSDRSPKAKFLFQIWNYRKLT